MHPTNFIHIDHADTECGISEMRSRIDNATSKQATNFSINKDLLADARSLNINLSATLEAALREKINQKKRELWLQENRKALEACNELAEKNGLFSDKHRIF